MEKFRINFDFIRLSKVKKGTDRKTKNTKKIDKRKKTKLTEKVDIGGHVLLFTETRKKKMYLENFIKVQLRINHFLIITKYF